MQQLAIMAEHRDWEWKTLKHKYSVSPSLKSFLKFPQIEKVKGRSIQTKEEIILITLLLFSSRIQFNLVYPNNNNNKTTDIVHSFCFVSIQTCINNVFIGISVVRYMCAYCFFYSRVNEACPLICWKSFLLKFTHLKVNSVKQCEKIPRSHSHNCINVPILCTRAYWILTLLRMNNTLQPI